MVLVMKPEATSVEIKNIANLLEGFGLKAHISQGSETTIIGVIGDKSRLRDINLELLDGVDRAVPVRHSYKLASKEFNPAGSLVQVGDVKIGGNGFCMMAGPCAVESEEQVLSTARAVRKSGAAILRGGAYKPRTSPYSFQGLEEEGLRLLRKAADETGLKVVSEIVGEYQMDAAEKYIDMIQVGARNMQNFRLLKAIGQSRMPVLLKRGNASTVSEWLDAAEYIMSEGNYNVVLCERGIRTFETATRNTLDISAVAVLKEKTHLPVIIDPSHAAGKAAYIESLSLAAVAAGADGLIVEVHPEPKIAMSDAAQQLSFDQFGAMCKKIQRVAEVVGKSF